MLYQCPLQWWQGGSVHLCSPHTTTHTHCELLLDCQCVQGEHAHSTGKGFSWDSTVLCTGLPSILVALKLSTKPYFYTFLCVWHCLLASFPVCPVTTAWCEGDVWSSQTWCKQKQTSRRSFPSSWEITRFKPPPFILVHMMPSVLDGKEAKPRLCVMWLYLLSLWPNDASSSQPPGLNLENPLSQYYGVRGFTTQHFGFDKSISWGVCVCGGGFFWSWHHVWHYQVKSLWVCFFCSLPAAADALTWA